ncbi:Leucyl/phenylalanyl-tRNA protein transferase family protein [Babesia bovis T2Bo]|uniref:Leu/Phe-tRNA protein transferase, putative n=1 Tax=Babesia bovis TaxID=5865 RepID=A7AUJ7_BABBO|nr:Leucyl/phenylalanyl-tRNA protein transferase family protein [Babesia bovis T2Bo]EDO06608.1 Leucyl/phenylalanyl-tRNA protein transferase family protein [Babesia bovis T2Bo]|eukprot:XP_001610176.1 Leu/Phe-tRNA protein transferase [Babesia bovis T2Bo]
MDDMGGLLSDPDDGFYPGQPTPVTRWELAEQKNREWDRMLIETSSRTDLELRGHCFECTDIPSLDPDVLEHGSCFASSVHSDRWRRLVSAIQDSKATQTAVVAHDTMSELVKVEILLFGNNSTVLRQQLVRGLIFLIWNNHTLTQAPWYSRLMQLARDIDACCFLRRLADENCRINLSPLITPYSSLDDALDIFQQEGLDGETAWSPYVEGELMYRLASRGFITVAVSVEALDHHKRLLIPKMHTDRCYLRPLHIRMTKRGKNAAKHMRITLDTVFNRVIKGIVRQHGENWMYPEMQREFNQMYYQKHRYEVEGTTLHSVEVWQGRELVAGEIGFITGGVYTSVTGFHTVSSSGTFQMYSLAAILHFQGIDFWDLGMDIPYKRSLGANVISRGAFIDAFTNAKRQERTFEIPQRFRDHANGVALLEEFENEQRRCGVV